MKSFQNNQNFQLVKSLTKKERRKLRHQEKEIEVEKARKRRAFLKFTKFLLIILSTVVIGFLFFKSLNKTQRNLPGQFFKEQSRIHINPNQEHPPYSSNPPTSGWHWFQPAQTGIYDQELPDEQIVHNLEHSHVWISYRPDLDGNTAEKLAEIAKKFSSKIIMTPRSKNDSLIALASWQYLLKLDSFNENAILEFINAHRGRAGPENPPDFGFRDFRNK